MSRADQSLTRHTPNTCRLGFANRNRLCRARCRARRRSPPPARSRAAATGRQSAPSRLRLGLPTRPPHGRAAGDHRRGPAVIADGHVLVVRQQRVVGPHHRPDVGGVEDRRVEVRVVADRPPAAASRPRPSSPGSGSTFFCRRAATVLSQQLADATAQRRPAAAARAPSSGSATAPGTRRRRPQASPSNSAARWHRRKSRMRSPMATPMRGGSGVSAR